MSYNINMSKQSNKKTIGTLQAAGVAFHQGFEGVLVTLIGIFIICNASGDKAAFSSAILGVKEVLALIVIVIWTIYKNGLKFFKELFIKLKTRQGLWFILAGVVGTSMGNFFYILGVVFAGSGYGVILTSLYPVFSMLLVRLFQKEKEPKLVWVGVAIAVVGGFMTVLLPVLVNGSSFSIMKFIGMIFGLLAAIFWAFEGLFINMGLKAKKQHNFSNGEIIITRNIFTTFMTIFIIMPFMSILGPSFGNFVDILIDWRVFLIVFAIAINIIILRALHVSAIKNVGPKVTAIIDTNNFIVPAIVAQIFVALPFAWAPTFSGSTIDWWAYILLIPIIIGVFMVVHFHKDEKDEMPLDSVNWQKINNEDTPEKHQKS